MSSASIVARATVGVARLFYRLEVVGERPPATGPLLVVANHPNALLDTALVTLATGRPARFLAKSTLFDDPTVAWLVRASGALPVYRQQDAPSDASGGTTAGNAAMFHAAESALGGGDAIAFFPEGVSHVRPSLAPLKTGAARLALGAARRLGGAFPLVPVGITLDDRAIFRSTGLLVVGPPVAWDDLAARVLALGGPDDGDALDHDAVRALTARIDDALRAVTASYASWDDARLVATAERVHAAAVEAARLGLPGAGGKTPLVASVGPRSNAASAGVALGGPPLGGVPVGAGCLGRSRLGASLLRRARAAEEGGDPGGTDARATLDALARDLRGHERLLGTLRLTPADLAVPSDFRTAAGWARRRSYLPLGAALVALGAGLAWVPYRLTGVLAGRVVNAEDRDVLATAKALVGGACFLVWTLLLAVVAGLVVAWWAALLVLLVVPPLLVLTLFAGEGWQFAWRDARRFFTLRARPDRVAGLRTRQAALARRVELAAERLGAAVG